MKTTIAFVACLFCHVFGLKLQFFRFFNQDNIYISTETRIFVSVYKYVRSDMRNSNGETTTP